MLQQITDRDTASAALTVVDRYLKFCAEVANALDRGLSRGQALREAEIAVDVPVREIRELSRLDLRAMAELALDYVTVPAERVAMIRELLAPMH